MKTLLRDTLRSLFTANKDHILDIADESDFCVLWKDNGTFANDVLIVWDETFRDSAMGAINSHDFLGPVEYAACRQKHWEECGNSATPWRTVAVDLNPVGHQGLPLTRLYHCTRLDGLQWLRVISVAELIDAIKKASISGDLTSIVDDLFCAAVSPSSHPPSVSGAEWMHHLRLLITEQGEQAEVSRHAIANAVGPLLVLGNSFNNPSPHQIGILTLVKGMNLQLDHRDVPTFKEDEPVFRWKWILMDDQLEQGWNQWFHVKAWNADASSVYWPGPDDFKKLLDRLRRQVTDHRAAGAPDCRFHLRLDEDEENLPEVLFLDLRLFEKHGWQAEQDFFTQLIPLCENFVEAKDKYAYLGFRIEELAAARAFYRIAQPPGIASTITDKKDQRTIVLTLLPRLLALADMSLPIVLFSTTLQRDILEKLKDYRNIFTGFNKNVLAGGNVQPPSEYLAQIEPELVSYLQWRFKLGALSLCAEPPKLGPSAKHWELYFDESGQNTETGFVVSCWLVGYKGTSQPRHIHDAMTQRGIRWTGVAGETSITRLPATPTQNYLAKVRGADAKDQWESLADVHNQNGFARLCSDENLTIVPLSLFSEEKVPRANPTRPSIAELGALDQLFLRMMRDVTEAILFDVLPHTPMQTWRLFCATRLAQVSEEKNYFTAKRWIEDNRDAYAQFGKFLGTAIDRKRRRFNVLLQSVDDANFGVSVHEAAMTRGGSGSRIAKCCRGVSGVTLTDWRDVSGLARFSPLRPTYGSGVEHSRVLDSEFRHMHDLADLLAHFSELNGTQTSYGAMEGWDGFASSAFKGTTGTAGKLLRISRYSDADSRNPAMAAWVFGTLLNEWFHERGLQANASSSQDAIKGLLEMGVFAISVLYKLRQSCGDQLKGGHLADLALQAAYDRDFYTVSTVQSGTLSSLFSQLLNAKRKFLAKRLIFGPVEEEFLRELTESPEQMARTANFPDWASVEMFVHSGRQNDKYAVLVFNEEILVNEQPVLRGVGAVRNDRIKDDWLTADATQWANPLPFSPIGVSQCDEPGDVADIEREP